MKAWFVWFGDWGDYVHGETPALAKQMFKREWGPEMDWESWIYLRPIRCPRLDDIPITSESILLEDHWFEGEKMDHWYPICKCGICKGNEG